MSMHGRFGVGSISFFLMNIFFIILAVGLFLSNHVVDSVPYLLLTNTRAKCLSVVVPQGQTVTIGWQAPDLQITDDEDDPEVKKMEEEKTKAGIEDGQDSEWNKRLQEKLERMRAKKMRDMSITVSQSSMYAGGADGETHRSRRYTANRNYASGIGRIREELTKKEGSIDFQTNDLDGKVDICIQSIIASAKSPARIALNVTVVPTEGGEDTTFDSGDSEGDTNKNEGALEDGVSGPANLESAEVKAQMGRFERDLATLKSRVKNIISNADFNKEQSADFHEQSVAMNRAATYWPIIHLIVIVVAGFTQANHIVTYMKTRHIV